MELLNILTGWLKNQAIPELLATSLGYAFIVAALVLATVLVRLAAGRSLVRAVELFLHSTRNKWDDSLARRNVIKRGADLTSVIFLYLAIDLFLPATVIATEFLQRLAMVILIIAGARVLTAMLLAGRDIVDTSETGRSTQLRGYIDAITIAVYVMAVIGIISTLTATSPWGILSILGGFTVVLLLVFKDTILGFVASLQLAGNDMVRIGDWIEMPKYNADGDVIDVSIHTVKVRNWDKTITTIPTYTLVSDAFRNWRGMTESGGRRIKRSLYIDMSSISFCTDEMLSRFSRYHLITEYIAEKEREIGQANQEQGVDSSLLINGRRQTNIGVFRAYVTAYLKNHPKIHKEMTFLVRHLEPTANGLPLQIYVFSNDQAWAHYEAIQADIFDHLLAAAPEFDLRIFQNPSGGDFRRLLLRETCG